MLELALKALISYLLGSLLGALVVGRFHGGVDIRNLGSGNAGGTNALRTRGKAFAFWVMVIDIGKGVLAVTLVPSLTLFGVGGDALLARDWLVVACALAVILGHIYPLWFDFQGGKGAATLIGVVLGVQPWLLIPVLLVWLVIVMLSGYVGLGTMGAGVSLPVFIALAHEPLPAALFTFGVIAALLMVYTHRSNIVRMLNGDEHRARALWLLRR